ncbi:MAG: ferredoxin [Candidatus Woesearchaeota archaeon]
MAKQYRVVHDRPNCIGCAACEAVCPTFWEMNADGKSDLKGAKPHSKEKGWTVLEIDESKYKCNLEAAESCPVNVIHLEDAETNERII